MLAYRRSVSFAMHRRMIASNSGGTAPVGALWLGGTHGFPGRPLHEQFGVAHIGEVVIVLENDEGVGVAEEPLAPFTQAGDEFW